jgi:hypothetical protein
MMKKLFAILVVALISIQAFSQIDFGLKVGAASTTVPTYDVSTGTSNIDAVKNSQWGFEAGVFLRLALAGIYIQPEVSFASTSFDYNVSSTGVTPSEVAQTFNRLSVPILLGVKLGPVRLNAGPAASIMIGSPKDLVNDPDFEQMYKSALWGYQAGIGIDVLKHLTFDARYAGSFGENSGDAVDIGGQTFQLNYGKSSFILSVGFKF